MYMTWRVLHSLVHHVDQAFADGCDLKRLERRPFLLIVGKLRPSCQTHVKHVCALSVFVFLHCGVVIEICGCVASLDHVAES